MKKDYKELYEKITRSDWFKKAYHDKSLGECPIVVEELEESEDEKIMKGLIDIFNTALGQDFLQRKAGLNRDKVITYLEKQKETLKSANSIPSDCWHKVADSFPDSTREVICKDAIGNFFIGRYYKGFNFWKVSMYDDVDKSNEDNPPVVMWCDIPSEKQKEQNPVPKFRIGDIMRTKQEASEGIVDGMPVIVSIDDTYYYCTNEKIPISEQDEYEYPTVNTEQKSLTIESAYKKFVNPETLKGARTNKYIKTQLLWELMHNGIITEVDYLYLTNENRKPDFYELGKTEKQKPDTRDADDLQLLGFIYDLLNEIKWKDSWAMSKEECLRRLNDYRPQKPAEWSKESCLDETKQECSSIDISGSIKTSRIKTLENLLSYLKYERKSTQEEINTSFIPCLENLLKDVENTNDQATINGEPISSENQSVDIPLAEWNEDIIRKAVKEVGLTQYQIDWFKSNVFPPKQEWSEEDEKMKESIIKALYGGGHFAYEPEIIWLKSLPERFNLQPKQEWSKIEIEQNKEK